MSISGEELEGLTLVVELLDIPLPNVLVGHNYNRRMSLLCKYLHEGDHTSDMVRAYHPGPVYPLLSSQMEHLTCAFAVLLEKANMVKDDASIDHYLGELK